MSPPISQETLHSQIKEALARVKYPGYSRNIVSFGVVKEITARNGAICVGLEINSAKPETAFQIQTDARKALADLPALGGYEVRIEVTSGREQPRDSTDRQGTTPGALPREPRPDGTGFDPDPMIAAMARPDLAPDAGYGEEGPNPLGGPMGDRASTTWRGPAPVFQWEIDPSDPERQQYGEAETERDGWIFRAWWQVHPAGLVYASISAIGEEEEERPHARQHPIGRNVAVNLVYDLKRQGVVAVYGTALDFRPFVTVFLQGFGIPTPDHAGAVSPEETQP